YRQGHGPATRGILMSTASDHEPRRRRWVSRTLIGLAALAAVGVAAAVVVPMLTAPPSASDADVPMGTLDTGDDEDMSTDPLAAVSPSTAAKLTDDEQAELARASTAVSELVAATDEIGVRGDGS